MAKKSGWQPLQRANVVRRVTEAEVALQMKHRPGETEAEARAALDAEVVNCEYWVNDIYQVALTRIAEGKAIHLNIRRRDGKVIFRDWRHFQWIKNQLVDPECEGFELYPAESRLNDTSNKYHLWVFTDPQYRIPFGMNQRDVLDDDGERRPGYRQRPLPRKP
jgi:hypothetical protein